MLNIAVMGFGTVGSGTVELFYQNKESLAAKLREDIDIRYILDLRKFPGSPYENKLTDDFTRIEEDDGITAVAELMGGLNPAYDYTKRLLQKGKSVITSNKELVARHGAELLKIAGEHNCFYLFEGAVGGAIPIIRPVQECLAADRIVKIQGILNGTTNFILTKIFDERMAFEDALKLSQDLGYAEKDPAADVSGADSCRKICILASLAFGKHIYPEWVYTKGITDITAEDAAYAESYGAKIKLIASAEKEDDGLRVTVEPRFVCNGNQISHVSDVFNAVTVFAEAAGELMFFGRGAGKLPTASAVLGDMIQAVGKSGMAIDWADSKEGFILDHSLQKRSFFVRIPDTTADTINDLMPVTFIKRADMPADEFGFITPAVSEKELKEIFADFNIASLIPINE
jgi:homoserine dehydrogenase